MRGTAGVLILLLAGCSRDFEYDLGFREKADWDYVEAAWGGAKAGPAEVQGDTLHIPFVLGLHEPTRTDSGICIYDPAAEVHGSKIRVRLNRGLCSNSVRDPVVAELPKPAPGEYEIVYDDFFAGYPVMGKAVIAR